MLNKNNGKVIKEGLVVREDQKFESDEDLLELAMSYVEKGKEVGREEGRKEGIIAGVRAVAINMITEGYADESIMSVTGLTKQDMTLLKETL